MDELVLKFRDVPTTAISDAVNGLNNLDPSIKPLKEEYKFAGRALTAKAAVGDNMAVQKAIRAAKPGDIIVIDAKGDQYRAMAGDFVVGMAQTMGVGAIVVDGAIRDVQAIKDLNFPVFTKGTTIASSGKAVGEINIPISCGGQSINPGDIIVGDADGVTVIPQEIAQEVYDKAVAKVQKDEIRAEKVSGNREAIIEFLDKMIGK